MPSPSVTYSFTNNTTADATQVNTNFTDVINGASDGTKDYNINALTVAGTATLNGAINLGNSTADDITVTGSVASTIPWKENATYNLGSATLAPNSIYLGDNTRTVRLLPGTLTSSYTITLPVTVPSTTGMTAIFDTSAVMSFRYSDKFTASKTTTYTATGDETVIPCSASGGAFTVTLPAAASYTGKKFIIIKTDTSTNAVTIDGNSSETINGQTTISLNFQYESVEIMCDGSNWFVISRSPGAWRTSSGITITGTTSNPTKATTTEVDRELLTRDGNYLVVRGEYGHSNNAGTAAGSGDYLFAVPGGFTIDTNLVTAYTTVEGNGGFYLSNAVGTFIFSSDNSVVTTQVMGSVIVYDSTKVRMIGITTNNTGCLASGFNALTAGAWKLAYEYRVPISGWVG